MCAQAFGQKLSEAFDLSLGFQPSLSFLPFSAHNSLVSRPFGRFVSISSHFRFSFSRMRPQSRFSI
jgi:hypothetical protein